MARHVRIRVSGGMYHVFARGHDRDVIFAEDHDREHFLELLEELSQRFRIRVYAFALIPNHYHLLVGTPGGNISQGMQWLNGSYGIWYNRKHHRTGHLFGERFKAVLIEDGGWLLEASVYVHLNCVATAAMGWGKRAKRAQGQGVGRAPTPAEVERRLEELRRYPWSTYRGYAGYAKMPGWVEAGLLWHRVQKKGQDSGACYRALVEDRIRQGVSEGLGAQVRWGLVLGGERFARNVRRRLHVGRESGGRRGLNRWMSFEAIVHVVERMKGATWAEFRDRHGDAGRDVVLWAGRRFGGMTLKELGDRTGGMDYGAVAVAIIRLSRKAQKSRVLRKLMRAVEDKCKM